jgi:hypothetical protein
MARNARTRRLTLLVTVAGLLLALLVTIPALPQTCTNKHSDPEFTGHGANRSGPYNSTCETNPQPSQNGQGNTNTKHCAGCVGNADDKNPPGQEPGPQDPNRGYECDQPGDPPNQGVAEGNPAHSGCAQYPIS